MARPLQLLNECKDLPSGALWQIRRCLRCIDLNHLDGIGCVQLIDELPDVKKTSAQWYEECRRTGRGIYAWYNPETEMYCAKIVLHMPELCHGIPSFLWWTSVPTLLITKVIAHEVAHHLKAKRGYIFSRDEEFKREWQEEAAADRYAFDLIRRMREKWWYWLGHELIDVTAQVYYHEGIRRWEEKNYVKAAACWNKVMKLDSYHTYAAHWYWRALEMSESSQDANKE